jgi:hypothetical protein
MAVQIYWASAALVCKFRLFFFSGDIAWDFRRLIGGAGRFFIAVKNDPARCSGQKKPDTRQGKPMLVNQLFNTRNLLNILFLVKPIVGPGFAPRADEAFLFIFTDPFLR